MTSLAYFHDCHCCYNERSIVQKKKKLLIGTLRHTMGESFRRPRIGPELWLKPFWLKPGSSWLKAVSVQTLVGR